MRTIPTINTRYEHVNNFINTLAPVVCNAWVKYRREGKKTISPAVILAQAAKESREQTSHVIQQSLLPVHMLILKLDLQNILIQWELYMDIWI